MFQTCLFKIDTILASELLSEIVGNPSRSFSSLETLGQRMNSTRAHLCVPWPWLKCVRFSESLNALKVYLGHRGLSPLLASGNFLFRIFAQSSPSVPPSIFKAFMVF